MLPLAATLHEDTNFRGRVEPITQGVHIALIPPPLFENCKSIVNYSPTWITFWCERDFDPRRASLWFPPTPEGKKWEIPDLEVIRRARNFFDGNWKDEIRSVSFSGDPGEDRSRKTIFRMDGSHTVGDERSILSENEINERVEAYKKLLEAKGVAKLVPR